ncbi:MAG: ribonuclease HI [Ancrocorticia sp.]|jgi:ribonuclease HI|nr:ribonuclease HI [Ancrocorticia sp.]MCI1896238.1 ribonuclease HI [Ancrocorticia sp.]MCI1932579.1 ribonuclease HI [Ancrocorticia sp.]MCI1963669.1 ribonuclease HI [Ancrocorticia sp.]MCI2002742.1 ribonuclease HI [Ancrocorticia sp.]
MTEAFPLPGFPDMAPVDSPKAKDSAAQHHMSSTGIIPGNAPVGRTYPGYDAVVATDGACSGNPGPGGWAWVEQKSGTHESGGEAHTTNNIMELTALLRALRYVGPHGSLLIRCDSQYVINTLTRWAPAWRRKGWRKADGKPVKNRELVQALLETFEARTGNTRVEWVKGHAGDEANEMCDSLAVAASHAAAPTNRRPRTQSRMTP